MIALGSLIAAGANRPESLTLLVTPGAAALDQSASLSLEPIDLSNGELDAAAAAGPERIFNRPELAVADFAPLLDPQILQTAATASGRQGATLGSLGDGAGHFAKGVSQFFGVNGYGQSFVYVVDCSGSMGEADKLQRAKYELLQSIEQLSQDQKYFVIFYNHSAIPMDAPAPVEANATTFARTRKWVEWVPPGGSTNPLPALLSALAMRPDAVFFLSDGLFDPSTNAQVRSVNRRRGRVPIHSIAFVSRENLGLMRAIARDSGGEFRFVK